MVSYVCKYSLSITNAKKAREMSLFRWRNTKQHTLFMAVLGEQKYSHNYLPACPFSPFNRRRQVFFRVLKANRNSTDSKSTIYLHLPSNTTPPAFRVLGKRVEEALLFSSNPQPTITKDNHAGSRCFVDPERVQVDQETPDEFSAGFQEIQPEQKQGRSGFVRKGKGCCCCCFQNGRGSIAFHHEECNLSARYAGHRVGAGSRQKQHRSSRWQPTSVSLHESERPPISFRGTEGYR